MARDKVQYEGGCYEKIQAFYSSYLCNSSVPDVRQHSGICIYRQIQIIRTSKSICCLHDSCAGYELRLHPGLSSDPQE